MTKEQEAMGFLTQNAFDSILTDDSSGRKDDHGNPEDWWQRSFSIEKEARDWEKTMLVKPGYKGGPGGEGWRYGYTYTINSRTRE